MQQALIPALAATHLCVVSRIYDPFLGSTAAEKQGECWVSDLRSLVTCNEVDAVIVAATPQVNLDVAIACVSAGKPIFVEKPMAVSSSAAQIFVEAIDRGTVVGIGHNFSFAPAISKFAKFREASGFGEFASGTLCFFASKPKGDRWGLGDPAKAFLLSHVTHALDVALLLLGMDTHLENVSLRASSTGDFTLFGLLNSPKGALSLHVTNSAPRFTFEISMVGDAGQRAALRDLTLVELESRVGDDREIVTWRPSTIGSIWDIGGYVQELKEFLECAGSLQPSSTLLESASRAVRGLEILDGICGASHPDVACDP